MATLIWFLPGAWPHMSYKITISKKALSHWLHWYGFSPVCVLMCILRLFFTEQAAWVWFLSSMSSYMLWNDYNRSNQCHIGYIDSFSLMYVIFQESLATMVTLIWFLLSVWPHIPLKSSFPREKITTMATLTWFLPNVSPYTL